MATFEASLSISLAKMGINFQLKDKQVDALRCAFNSTDAICVLPTGFGKSVIFQLLPCLLQAKFNTPDPMIVIVAAPLNAIMEDQTRCLSSSSVRACCISFDGSSATTYEDGEDIDDDEVSGDISLAKDVKMEDLKMGKYHIIYSHPEALRTPKMRKLMRTKTYQDRLCAVVVDEVHMISEWGDEFRPAFKHLGDLTCLFPEVAHIALTATCTSARIKELTTILQYKQPSIISVNPDRTNIYIEKKERLPNIKKFEKLDSIIEPLAVDLKEKLLTFPVTIVYMESLEALGYAYQLISDYMKEDQYIGDRIPENRIFAQYHKDYTTKMKVHIIKELSKKTPTVRLFLATIALGMGLHAPSVSRVIHTRPPPTLEAYMQEIGRAGRLGQAAQACLHYNRSDISKARKGITEDLIKFCENISTCLRLQLVKYFGFDSALYSGDKSNCCSNCRAVVVSYENSN